MIVKVVKKISLKDELTIMEAENVERLFILHLSRCDKADTANRLENIFLRLAEQFGKKKLDLLNAKV